MVGKMFSVRNGHVRLLLEKECVHAQAVLTEHGCLFAGAPLDKRLPAPGHGADVLGQVLRGLPGHDLVAGRGHQQHRDAVPELRHLIERDPREARHLLLRATAVHAAEHCLAEGHAHGLGRGRASAVMQEHRQAEAREKPAQRRVLCAGAPTHIGVGLCWIAHPSDVTLIDARRVDDGAAQGRHWRRGALTLLQGFGPHVEHVLRGR
mmetsp:Transcript_149892/g.417639  ORF Transcript_149892/g.417639 Transcript_149892/m.417639 type:complete len:207 (+) Transcript_149892:217-837(+)